MEEFLVLNPPVATVLNEWFTASKKDMPARFSSRVSVAASATYTNAMTWTVLTERNLYPSLESEESSILVRRIRKGLASGIIRSRKTTTPNPPMKCVEDLQNNRPFGRLSTSVKIVEPVVVYPDTLSNQAFIRVNSPPHSTYGSIPNMNESSQDNTIIMNPS